jgi:flagellar assembly protein FliH
MTSTSSDRVVLRGLPADEADPSTGRTELRAGTWTRLGNGSVLGDAVTEATLSTLAERTREAARAQGYAAGWAQARRTFLEQARAEAAERAARLQAEDARAAAEREAATIALGAAVTACQGQVEEVMAALAERAVALALEIAEAVIGREVATAADPGGDALRRALAEVPPMVALTVRLHPDDRARLDAALLGDRPVRFADDPSLSRGDAVVETDTGVVDATLGAALARVREVLTA